MVDSRSGCETITEFVYTPRSKYIVLLSSCTILLQWDVDTVSSANQNAAQLPCALTTSNSKHNVAETKYVTQQCLSSAISPALNPSWCSGSFVGVVMVFRMSDDRITRLLYDQQDNAKRHQSCQRKRYKDHLRVNLKAYGVDHWSWEAADRSEWRRLCYTAVEEYEEQRLDSAKARRAQRKAKVPTCDSFRRTCMCIIGLHSHQRSCHRWDSSCRRLNPYKRY